MRNANKMLLWMIFVGSLVTRIDSQLHIPFVDSIRYVACKPGEMSIGFDGYASYLEIFLSWAFQWGIMGLLYKFNTGNWPPRPFQNTAPKQNRRTHQVQKINKARSSRRIRR
uniref:Vomeronasal type-1 receptor n=1 Tax=Ditylenchus dipsaci TaxID=166011 RepID=A0A915CZ56_9BILA